MGRRGTGPLINCEKCGVRIRKSKYDKRGHPDCHPPTISCHHCKQTLINKIYRQQHGRNCLNCPKECQYCFQATTLDKWTDHTSTCSVIQNMISKYKKFDPDIITSLMPLMITIYKNKDNGLPWGWCKYEIMTIIQNKNAGLEAIILAKQFRLSYLPHFIVCDCLRRFQQPKEKILADMPFILGDSINVYFAQDLIRHSGVYCRREDYRTEGFWGGYVCQYSFDRLYIDDGDYESIDIVHESYYDNIMLLKKTIQEGLSEYLFKDVVGVVIKYLFSDHLYVDKSYSLKG
jgi:hypothetical protein